MRRGAGQLIGMGLLAILIFFALWIWYAKTVIWWESVKRQALEEIYMGKEYLLVYVNDSSGKAVIQSAWNFDSHAIALVCNWMTNQTHVHDIDVWVPLWLKAEVPLPQNCTEPVCIVTDYGNIFCSIELPVKYAIPNETIDIAEKWLRVSPSYLEIPVNISSEIDFICDNSGCGYSMVIPEIESGALPIAVVEGMAKVLMGTGNVAITNNEILNIAFERLSSYCSSSRGCILHVVLKLSRISINVSGKLIEDPIIEAIVCDNLYSFDSCKRSIVSKEGEAYLWAPYPGNHVPLWIAGIPIEAVYGWSGYYIISDQVKKIYAALVVGDSYAHGIICFDKLCNEYATYDNSSRVVLEAILNASLPLPVPSNIETIEVGLTVLDIDRGWESLGSLTLELYRLGNESFGRVYLFSFGSGAPDSVGEYYSWGLEIGEGIVVAGRAESYRVDREAIDSGSPYLHSLALIAFDREGRWDIAIVKPMQIVFASTRRAAGWAEPGNLFITVDHSNNAYDASYEIAINYSKIFDLGLELPISTSPGTTTVIELRGVEVVRAPLFNQSIAIETNHRQTVEVMQSIPPPQEPSPPSEEPPEPSPQPEVIVRAVPVPTSDKPINMTVYIIIKGPYEPEDFEVWYRRCTSDYYTCVDGTIELVDYGDRIEGSLFIPNDERYDVWIRIEWRGKALEDHIVRNYLEETW